MIPRIQLTAIVLLSTGCDTSRLLKKSPLEDRQEMATVIS
jgi:hypothetical protein